MLSRVAESIFWMARYMERTNGMLRLLRTNYVASQSEEKKFSWRSILLTYGEMPFEKIDEIEHLSQKVLEHLLHDKENMSSVFNNVTQARENARAVQDNITKEVWQCLNEYYHLMRDRNLAEQVSFGDPLSALDTLIRHGMYYHGTVDITMSREEGFNYLNIGKFLERTIITVDMINIKLAEVNYNLHLPREAPQWRYLLYSLSGYELYMRTYRGTMQPEFVLQQILYSTLFPHSIVYCLQQISRYFGRLKLESLPESYEQLEFLIGRLTTNVKYSRMEINEGKYLQQFLLQTRRELLEISNGFSQYYFGNS